MRLLSSYLCIFFFQAEDGIRDWSVTGVQTCALPISCGRGRGTIERAHLPRHLPQGAFTRALRARSEERRVGEEGRSRWSPYHYKKKYKYIYTVMYIIKDYQH